MAKVLTIVGASARAAAFSARAAGFEPWCADLFADVDLQAVSTVERVDDYPQGLPELLHASPAEPWMYTGALENHPDLIDELARLRPLYGNDGGALRRARDPILWSRALAELGLPAPRASLSALELPRNGSWMRKPLRSANGQGVSLWTAEVAARASRADPDHWYFQERIAGIPIAAIFVAAEGEAAILGVTQQLVGGDWAAALSVIAGENDLHRPCENRAATNFSDAPFRYTGSLGPLVLEDQHYRTIKRIGSALARECGLVGLFGVDAILNAQNVWPVEINPRYTASIEVLERASAVRTQTRRPHRLLSIEWHEAACCFQQLPPPLGQSAETTAGKLIYYARRDGLFSRAAAQWAVERNLAQSRPTVADIPAAGTPFRQGQPVLTLLADGPSAASVCAELSRAAEELETELTT
ncbi:MAG: ATP-grasp domain-containing protein [Pirellulales bacterium]